MSLPDAKNAPAEAIAIDLLMQRQMLLHFVCEFLGEEATATQKARVSAYIEKTFAEKDRAEAIRIAQGAMNALLGEHQ